MTEFVNTFMGHAGFEELKTFSRQSTTFCRELVAILQERVTAEQLYAKSLTKASQRLQKASTNVLLTPLITSWKKVAIEMNNEAEAHKSFSIKLQEECSKPLDALIEKDVKKRKAIELEVDSKAKIMSDKFSENKKIKRRLHQLAKENENLLEQIHGPRPKTDKDHSKLCSKQVKTEEVLLQVETDYYNSIIALESARENWEIATYDSCKSIQIEEEDKIDQLCILVRLYNTTLSSFTAQLESCSHKIRQLTTSLDPEGEILIIAEKKKGTPYKCEQILCDFYEENLSNQYKSERRIAALSRSTEKFLADIQKSQTNYTAVKKLESAPGNKLTEKDHRDVQRQLTKMQLLIEFLEFNKFKLQRVVSLIENRTPPTHACEKFMDQYTDKQGMTHSTLKRELSDLIQFDFPSNDINLQYNEGIYESIPADTGCIPEPGTNGVSRAGTLTYQQVKSLEKGMTRRTSRKQTAAPPPPSAPPSHHCFAKFDYAATQDDELTLKEGDKIRIIKKNENGWWKGELNGRQGMFPSNYTDADPI